ncbi:predicted protein [Naegleria gruberi]|uniref:Predicted protein n=1 Tax=Naegleria gruberi TaxID=5762 RepID=D2UYQ8_NAEGR|nr:uncharacterized protein NAEGRDRAFT_45237 [Naegleria gruberi]EFC50521.1 predicted protein [Naegleria gruberi]|eukprot:XP_002683265.1 predicted protein [Naegleria gruberi strain NEG-M]
MGSALSTRYPSSGSETSSSSVNHTPRESRVVVVAKRANSTPNLKSDLNASPTNFSSSNNVANSATTVNTSPTSSMNNNISPSMNQFKFPRHGANGSRSSSFTRSIHGGTISTATSAVQNANSGSCNNIPYSNNNNFDTTSMASIQPSVITTSNIKLQAHESAISLLRFSPGVARTPSPDNTSDALSSPKSIEQLVDNTHIFTTSNPSIVSSIGNNQSPSPPTLSYSNTPTGTTISPFNSGSCSTPPVPSVSTPPTVTSTSLPPIHPQTISGFNSVSSPNNVNSASNTASPTHFTFPSHTPTLYPIQTESNSLPSIDRVSTPNRYRHIPPNAFAAFNSNRRGSVTNPIVPVAIVENNNSGTSHSIEVTNSFSSLSQWGGINEEIILPETQKMNEYNKELKKQVKSTISPEDLTRLEIGDNSDILIQMLLYNPIATVITDLDGNIIVMNEPFKQLFRVDDPETITSISIFIPKEYRKFHEKILRKYKKKNRPKIKRVTLGLTQYGDKIPISISVTSSELQSSGKPVYICFIKDLTSEFKLNTLDVMYQNVTGLSSIPIIGIDQDCRITLFNHAAEETWMISKTEVLENNVKILMPEATGKVHDKFVTEYIIGKREKSVIDKVKQVIGRRVGNGKEFPLEIKVAEVKHELNNKRSFVAFLRDLTAVMTAREFQLTLYPEKVVNMLESGERTIHHHHTCASVLFCDIVGFTEISRQMESNELVMILDEIISMFDNHLLSKYRIEKIKTMGDNYMCATGLDDSTDHANNIVEAAIEMQKLMHEFNERHAELRLRFPDHCNNFGQVISVRVGVNSGDLVAGIVGNRKPVYDVFGDNVNLASRMESSGIESQVQITPKTYSLLKNELKQYFTIRRDNKVKGIGLMDTYITNLSPESFDMKSARINSRHAHQNSGIPNIGDIDEHSFSLTSTSIEDDIDGVEHSNL